MFIFIIAFHNVEKYIGECLQSLISQDYTHWRAILVDDCSADKTLTQIPNDQRFTVIRNSSRLTALANIHTAIITGGLNDEDIICILDGDDKLTDSGVCNLITNLYEKFDPLLSYGQYITSQGLVGHCRDYDIPSFQNLRYKMYWASHLRTFKYKLYKELLLQDPDLSCYKDKNGEMYKMAYDVAMMTPLLEIAGLNRIRFNPTPVYWYRIHPNNDHLTNVHLQAAIAREIYAKPKFKQIF